MKKNLNQEEINCLNKLPDDIILDIFSRVSREDLIEFGSVCPRFLRISRDKRLWKKVSLAGRDLTGRDLADIITTYDQFEELDLSECTVRLPIDFPAPKAGENTREKNFSRNLETLNLSKVVCLFKSENVTYEHVAVKGICKMLKIFKPKKLIAHNVIVNNRNHFRRLFSRNTQLEAVSLEYLRVSFSLLLSSEWRLEGIFLGCGHLREINLSNSKLTRTQLLNLCQLPRNVENFLLNNVDLGEQCQDIFEALLIFAPNLKCLGVSLSYLTKPNVLAILKRHQNLESFRLYHDEWSRVRSLKEWKPGVFVDLLNQVTIVKKIHFVMRKGALGKVHKKRIPKQVAMLWDHLNADDLHIETKINISNCDWQLTLLRKHTRHFWRPWTNL